MKTATGSVRQSDVARAVLASRRRQFVDRELYAQLIRIYRMVHPQTGPCVDQCQICRRTVPPDLPQQHHENCPVGRMAKLCTCVRCGWVHMAQTRAFAEAEAATFNAWIDTQPANVRAMYPPSAVPNESCNVCGGDRFREFVEGDCPDGVTISGVIWESSGD